MGTKRIEVGGMAVAVIVLMFAAAFSGCVGDDEGVPKLIQTGSSTVEPLAIAWAQEFKDADISVSGGGSSHGINALLTGQADLGDASRLMKGSDYEKVGGDPNLVKSDGTATGAANGVWPYKWVVAFDVLTVVVNKDNDFISELNYSQMYAIFTDDDPVDYWDEVPGLTGAPHEKIEIHAPDEASGTYDYFFEEIIADWGDEGAPLSRLHSGDGVYHPNADDNRILAAIKANEYSIGFFGYSYYIENSNDIKAVAIGHDDEQTWLPSAANVASYPMARPLHIYTDGVPKGDDVINKYLQFVLGDEGQALVPDVGYVQLDLVDASIRTSQLNTLKNA
jgi:phosphate transport system substrate-binding protein